MRPSGRHTKSYYRARRRQGNRLGALTGIAGAAFYVAQRVRSWDRTKAGRAHATVVAHYVDKRNELLLATALAIVGVALLLWFLGHLKAVIDRAEGAHGRLGTVTLAAWIAWLVTVFAGATLSVAIIWRGPRRSSRTL